MKITLFTGNQPRHLALAESLADVAQDLFVVNEATTLFTGRIDDHLGKSAIMEQYFARVIAAEREVFGQPRFLRREARQMVVRFGDLDLMPPELFASALDADLIVVFGTSYIKGALGDRLIERQALNVHMGVSPYFRGSSCNFWAIHDGRIDLVGATIHRLGRGLDSGGILFHALPRPEAVDPFTFGMQAVRAAHDALAMRIRDGSIATIEDTPQDKDRQIRYSRKADFTDAVAERYLASLPAAGDVLVAARARRPSDFVRPTII